MEESKKAFVSIYCKIFTDCFSPEMIDRMATGQEIYDFLMKDAGMLSDEGNHYQTIPGDCNLWYLGCNDKYGFLEYKDFIMEWSYGDSSFDRVEAFVTMIFLDGYFTGEQYRNLMFKIQEGRHIDNMNDIRKYLLATRERKPWTKTKEAYEFRGEIKDYKARVEQHFRQED